MFGEGGNVIQILQLLYVGEEWGGGGSGINVGEAIEVTPTDGFKTL